MKTIYLIFDEVRIPAGSHVGMHLAKDIAYADATNFPYCVDATVPIFSNEDIILPAFITSNNDPLSPILVDSLGKSRLDIFNKVKEYFQIFEDLHFEIANNFPLNSWSVKNAAYIKIHNTYLEMSMFNLTDDKWKPLKKFICRGIDKVRGFILGFTGIGFCEGDARVIIHEIGHTLGLEHHGIITYGNEPTYPRGRPREILPYAGPNSDFWSPIMGQPTDAAVMSWSNGDYINSTETKILNDDEVIQDGIVNNDIKTILDKSPVKLIKVPPKDYVWETKYNNPNSSKNRSRKTRKLLRMLTKADGTHIGGMLGYPFDFDLYAILVRPGEFTAEAVPEYPEATSCSLEILACNCLFDLKKFGILETFFEDEFGGAYINGSTLHQKDSSLDPLDFQCVYVEHNSREESKYIYQRNTQEFEPDEGPFTGFSSINMYETSLIILKVSGGYKNVDKNTKQPNVPDKGISQYGALGKYTLKLSKPSENTSQIAGKPDGNFPLSIGSCETYQVCSQTQYSLFPDYTVLNPDTKGLHTLDLEVLINGKVQTKSFLVYGEPKNRRDRLPENGVFLDVIIDGECKKQEFVVGLKNSDFL